MANVLAFMQALFQPLIWLFKLIGVCFLLAVVLCISPLILTYFLYDRTLKFIENKRPKQATKKNENSDFGNFLNSVRARMETN